MIYVRLAGRIGNQLFMYAYAKKLSEELDDKNILIDDKEVLKENYENSLIEYDLKNVKYVHSHKKMYLPKNWKKTIIFLFYKFIRRNLSYQARYKMEKKMQPFFNKNGMCLCGMEYLPHNLKKGRDVFLSGYFQSEDYFKEINKELIEEISLLGNKNVDNYPGIEEIKARNSVCISIKVQHNVGSSIYDVCNDGYWEKAIDYICKNVDNPLFFICSDNVEYVKEKLIDCNKYDVIFQQKDYPVSVSLAVMGNCKHFVIGNTTYGWWAQYLGKYENKIVVAPSRWFKTDIPVDIYQKNWHLLEV